MTIDRVPHDLELEMARATTSAALFAVPEVPIRIGRYLVVGRLGKGGMGVVYAAYDPALDRKVAVKLLQPGLADAAQTGRLVREARALAQLSHPNVVAVHDVGTIDSDQTPGPTVFIAMELVDGRTLTEWRASTPHHWSDVVEIMLAAGEGLRAAHARGLVHRDFKPDNIMVGRDGRVRVMDFGLVRRNTDNDESCDDNRSATHVRPLPTNDHPTATGARVGTPAYMAPEQWDGLADARADIYAFCVTSCEALFGCRPFAGATGPAIAGAAHARRFQDNSAVRIPAWLRTALVSGLAADPGERVATMDALLAALRTGRRRARMRWAAVACGVCVAVVGLGAGWNRLDRSMRLRACEIEGSSITTTWNEDAAGRVSAALVGTGLPFAVAVAERVTPMLSAYASTWADARTEACARAEVDATWDAETLEHGRWCLDARRLELDALVRALIATGGDHVAEAVQAAANLPLASQCLDADLLARVPSPPTELREAIVEVHGLLSRAVASFSTAAYGDGIALARDALDQAQRIGWPPLVAECQHRLGDLLQADGKHTEAVAVLEQAYFTAMTAAAPITAAETAGLLTFVVGFDLARPDEGRRWSQHADVELAKLPDPTGLRAAYRLAGLSQVAYRRGDYAAMKNALEEVRRLRGAALGPEHPQVIKVSWGLAWAHLRLGELDDAQRMFEHTLELRGRVLGDEHPHVAFDLDGLGEVLRLRGDLAQSKQRMQRALEIRTRALPADHPDIANNLYGLVTVDFLLGDYSAAKSQLERCLRMREKTYGPEHPDVASTLAMLGTIEFELGDLDAAEATLQRALDLRVLVSGQDHPDTAPHLDALGRLKQERGDTEAARVLFQRAYDIASKASGPDNVVLVTTGANLGLVLLELGEVEDAEAVLTHALALLDKAKVGGQQMLTVLQLLANARSARGDLDGARRDAMRALATVEATASPDPANLIDTLCALAKVEHDRNDLQRAEQLLRRALAHGETSFGASDARVVQPLLGLAKARLAQADARAALALGERALALLEASDSDRRSTARRAKALFIVAQARFAARPRDTSRARALAHRARDLYGTLGPATDSERAEIDAWLATSR